MLGVEVAGRQDRQSPSEKGGQFRSDQLAGRRRVSLQDFHQFAGQYDLNGSSLQLGQARNGHRVVDYTTVDQDGLPPPLPVCAVADIIGTWKECLT